MPADPAPKGPFNRACDFVYSVDDCSSAALNMTTISEKAYHAPQRVRFFNSSTDAAESVTVTPELSPGQNTFNVVIPIAPLGEYTTSFPVAKIVSATSGGDGVVSAIAMWWTGGSVRINK
jgi:hypothetical protein